MRQTRRTSRSLRVGAAAFALTALPGCIGASGASLEALRARSTFDLQCPSHELQLVNIDTRTKGIRGCGRQMTYVEVCDNRPDGWHCTWVLNAPAWYVAPARIPPKPDGSWWWTEPQGVAAPPGVPASEVGAPRPWQPATVAPQAVPPQSPGYVAPTTSGASPRTPGLVRPPRDEDRGF